MPYCFSRWCLLWVHTDSKGILPKGPHLPCVSMAGRALLAGYPQLFFLPQWLECYMYYHIILDSVTLAFSLFFKFSFLTTFCQLHPCNLVWKFFLVDFSTKVEFWWNCKICNFGEYLCISIWNALGINDAKAIKMHWMYCYHIWNKLWKW